MQLAQLQGGPLTHPRPVQRSSQRLAAACRLHQARTCVAKPDQQAVQVHRLSPKRPVHCAAAAPEDDEFDLGEFDEEELELDEGEGDFGDIGEVGNFEDFADLGDDEVNNIVAQLGADGVDEDSLQELLDRPEYRELLEDDQQPEEAAGGVAEVAEGEKWPAVPERAYFLSDLFGKAAYYDAAAMLEESFPEVEVQGIQSAPDRVLERDLYVCTPDTLEEVPDMIRQALQEGATALLLPDAVRDIEEITKLIPDDVPALYVPDVDETAQRLAVAFYDAPSRDLLGIAVCGSHGKTTTSWLIRGILEEVDQITGMIGTVEYAIAEDRLDEEGDLWEAREEDPAEGRECSAPFRITPYAGKYNISYTTPPGLEMQKLLAGMRDRGAKCVVVETAPDAIQAGHTEWLSTDVVVHTCIELEPPGGVGSGPAPAAAQEEQQELVQAALRPFERLNDATAQAAVINLDDPAAQLVLEAAAAVPCVTYAIDNQEADVVAESYKMDIWESEVFVRTPQGRLQIISPLLGRHNIYNILAAVATGIALKVPLKAIVAGIEAVEVIPGRSEVVDEGQEFSVIIDAADTPKALEAMLSAVRGEAKRVITVFGCRGEEDRTLRPYMAEVAHRLSDLVIVTNDSPRNEPPQNIVQDIVAGLPEEMLNRYSGYVYFPFMDQGRVPLWFEPYLQKAQRTTKRYVMEDRFSAIRAAIGTAGAGDAVIIAGRGHLDFMEYGDEEGDIIRGWFDDRMEVRSALSKLSYLNQLTKLTRKNLPWGNALEEMDTLIDPPEDRTTGSDALGLEGAEQQEPQPVAP